MTTVYSLTFRNCKDHCNVEKIIFTHKRTQTIWRGQCISHNEKYIEYHGMDSETGKLYAIKEIATTVDHEEELKIQLSRLTDLKHDRLFAIENFCQKTNGSKVVFYVLQESTFGYTSRVLSDDVKNFCKQISDVDDYLQEQQIRLQLWSLFVNADGESKAYDYGLEFTKGETKADNCGLVSTNISRSERGTCLSGRQIQFEYLKHFYQNLEDSWTEVLNKFETFAPSGAILSRATDVPASIEYKRRQSRMDFKRIERLGKGGFGKVYKIRDNTDNKYYALKKIKLTNNDKENNKIMKEVKYLSNLEHKHVVRYFHSWKELDEDDDSSGTESESEDLDKSDESNLIDNQLSRVSSRDVLYIKMELCENTLAHVIGESDLYKDRNLIWLYFKQILEGLHHIHGNGIIHRDLKPSNIFLDTRNQIKIGDFGFATNKSLYGAVKKENVEIKIENRSESCTSRVGTSYYEAPELLCDDVVICDNKLDMYSLGITLFEMCCKPFDTQSERAKVMENLRSPVVTFPADFNSNLDNQKTIIRTLLHHDPSKRFDCEQLMKCNLIPHIPEEKEEEKQLEMIKRVSNDSGSKLFLYFLHSCFEVAGRNHFTATAFVNVTQMENALRIITKVFEKHGGKCYAPSTVYVNRKCDDKCTRCVQTMTKDHRILVMPCSSRIPFLRYILSQNYYWVRSYSINKYCFDYDCSFDIITPISLIKQKCFLPDAEMLLILSNLADSFELHNVTININHTGLLEAILEECNFIDDVAVPTIIFRLSKLNKTVHTPIAAKIFPTYNFKKHIKFLDMTRDFKNIDKRALLAEFENENALSRATQALSELSNIIKVADEIGVLNGVILQMAMFKYLSHYSGMVAELTHLTTTVAIAGRFDKLLRRIDPSKQERFGVGLRIHLRELCAILRPSVKSAHVVIWTENNNALPYIHKILKWFWNNNINCEFIKVLGEKNCFKYSSKNSNTIIIKVSTKSITEQIFKVIYRTNSSTFKWEVNVEDLMMTIKTLSFIEPLESAVLKEKSEVSIRFSTKVDLPFFLKVKYKCEVVKELNKRNYSKETILVIVVDFNFGQHCSPPIYEKNLCHYGSATYSIVIIAEIPENVESPLKFIPCNLFN